MARATQVSAIGLHDRGRRAPGVAHARDRLHRGVRRHPDLDRAAGRALLEHARGSAWSAGAGPLRRPDPAPSRASAASTSAAGAGRSRAGTARNYPCGQLAGSPTSSSSWASSSLRRSPDRLIAASASLDPVGQFGVAVLRASPRARAGWPTGVRNSWWTRSSTTWRTSAACWRDGLGWTGSDKSRPSTGPRSVFTWCSSEVPPPARDDGSLDDVGSVNFTTAPPRTAARPGRAGRRAPAGSRR